MDRKIVLIVDDDPDHRTIAAALLSYGGFTVMEADSAFSAEWMTEAHLPDLVLLDLSMPGKTGVEWLAELRADPRTRHLPVAAYTSFADLYHHDLQRHGVRHVLHKVGRPSEFIEKVKQVLDDV
jgi:CheY-like chemotaxis protein